MKAKQEAQIAQHHKESIIRRNILLHTFVAVGMAAKKCLTLFTPYAFYQPPLVSRASLATLFDACIKKSNQFDKTIFQSSIIFAVV